MIRRCDRAILSPLRKDSWPLAANLPKGMRSSPRSIRQCFLPICVLHHRSLLFLRLRSRLSRQCQERTCRQGAGEAQWPDMRAFPEKISSRSIVFADTTRICQSCCCDAGWVTSGDADLVRLFGWRRSGEPCEGEGESAESKEGDSGRAGDHLWTIRTELARAPSLPRPSSQARGVKVQADATGCWPVACEERSSAHALDCRRGT